MSTKQVETATVVVPTTITVAGDATAIVTSAYMPNSPKTVTVSLTSDSVTNDVALAFRNALALDADVAGVFIVSGTSDVIILTDEIARANDSTLNIALATGTATGLTAAPTSADTTAGSGITNAYATLAEFKAWVTPRGGAGGTNTTDTYDDSVIEDLLNLSSRYIDGQCRRRFYASSVDEVRYFTAEDGGIVFIDDLSTDPTSVKIDDSFDRSWGTTLASSDLDLQPFGAPSDGWPYTYIEIAPHGNTSFVTDPKGVKITGKFGFPAVPDDIKAACLGIAHNIYQARTGQSSPGNITVTASGVVIRPQDVPGWAQKTIDRYKRIQ